MQEKVSAVVLAGGKSSRMGEDKALLAFGGFDTLIEYQFDRLSRYFDEVFVSIKQTKLDLDLPFLYDDQEISVPIAGIIKALETCQNRRLFVLAVDIVFFDQFEQLISGGDDSVVARSGSGNHPLCAIYTKDDLPYFEEALANGEFVLQKLIKKLNPTFVDFEEEQLTNLNYKNEYQKALKGIS